jgi:hypothetical protein
MAKPDSKLTSLGASEIATSTAGSDRKRVIRVVRGGEIVVKCVIAVIKIRVLVCALAVETGRDHSKRG